MRELLTSLVFHSPPCNVHETSCFYLRFLRFVFATQQLRSTEIPFFLFARYTGCFCVVCLRNLVFFGVLSLSELHVELVVIVQVLSTSTALRLGHASCCVADACFDGGVVLHARQLQ